MKIQTAYSLHNGEGEWRKRELLEWVSELFNAPGIIVAPGSTGKIRDYIRDGLQQAGWAHSVRIEPTFDLTVTGIYRDLAFQIQTGNVSRAMYDLIKMEYLYRKNKIEATALAVPTKSAAEIIGSNIANVDRLWSEIQLFDRIITVPILLLAFE
ncbi:MAG TPA: hypothetical protein VNX86_08510 [Rhizomicrobium sp.]|jgi:hypothetical protein|nr:hypothetical protein [Rhizomicrobium sp.]